MKFLKFIATVGVILITLFLVIRPNSAGEDTNFVDSNSNLSSSISSSKSSLNSSQNTSDWLDESRSFLKFGRFNSAGEVSRNGENYVVVFNPQSPQLEFQVIPGLAHPIGALNTDGEVRKEYQAYPFSQIIRSQNAVFQNKQPFTAINADYIDEFGKPQGLNISNGVSYSGSFAQQRSSFSISGGQASSRTASVGVGSNSESNLQFNTAGGNGRFYSNGNFQNICQALGTFACKQSTERSMAAVTSSGWVVWLVHNSLQSQTAFTPDTFDDVLQSVTAYFKIGTVKDALLFDGGGSPAMLWNKQIVYSNPGPIGSVFAVYLAE